MSSSQIAENYQLKWHSHLTNLNSSVATLYRYKTEIIKMEIYEYVWRGRWSVDCERAAYTYVDGYTYIGTW